MTDEERHLKIREIYCEYDIEAFKIAHRYIDDIDAVIKCEHEIMSLTLDVAKAYMNLILECRNGG